MSYISKRGSLLVYDFDRRIVNQLYQKRPGNSSLIDVGYNLKVSPRLPDDLDASAALIHGGVLICRTHTQTPTNQHQESNGIDVTPSLKLTTCVEPIVLLSLQSIIRIPSIHSLAYQESTRGDVRTIYRGLLTRPRSNR